MAVEETPLCIKGDATAFSYTEKRKIKKKKETKCLEGIWYDFNFCFHFQFLILIFSFQDFRDHFWLLVLISAFNF